MKLQGGFKFLRRLVLTPYFLQNACIGFVPVRIRRDQNNCSCIVIGSSLKLTLSPKIQSLGG